MAFSVPEPLLLPLLAAASGLIKKIMQCLGLGSAVQSDLGKYVTDPTKITARQELGALRRTVPERTSCLVTQGTWLIPPT